MAHGLDIGTRGIRPAGDGVGRAATGVEPPVAHPVDLDDAGDREVLESAGLAPADLRTLEFDGRTYALGSDAVVAALGVLVLVGAVRSTRR